MQNDYSNQLIEDANNREKRYIKRKFKYVPLIIVIASIFMSTILLFKGMHNFYVSMVG